ncbi:MAG: hypothetical protein ABIR18_14720, partial [Chitinophagaceae bacterium]
LHEEPNLNLIGFIFFATICSYSFHWYLTPNVEINSSRLQWLRRNRNAHTTLFFVGLAGTAYFGFFLLNHWPWLLLIAFVTFLYSAPKIPHPLFRILRKVAIGKTIFLAFVWMYVTTALPLQLSDRPWQQDFTLFAASRFFLVYAICIVFDYRDRDYDKSIGIRSLITWLSETGIFLLFLGSLLIFGLSTLLLLNYDQSYLIVLLLLVPGVLLAILYKRAITNFSDIMYYFTLDGLMALSSLLTLLLHEL